MATYSAAAGYLDLGLCPQCGDLLPMRARVIPISRHPRFLQDERGSEEVLADDPASA